VPGNPKNSDSCCRPLHILLQELQQVVLVLRLSLSRSIRIPVIAISASVNQFGSGISSRSLQAVATTYAWSSGLGAGNPKVVTPAAHYYIYSDVNYRWLYRNSDRLLSL